MFFFARDFCTPKLNVHNIHKEFSFFNFFIDFYEKKNVFALFFGLTREKVCCPLKIAFFQNFPHRLFILINKEKTRMRPRLFLAQFVLEGRRGFVCAFFASFHRVQILDSRLFGVKRRVFKEVPFRNIS